MITSGEQRRAGRDYLFRATPEECLNSATAYFSAREYEIEIRTENSVSMFRHSLTSGIAFIIVIMALFTFGLALLALLVFYLIKTRATIVATPAEEGLSRVAITWSNEDAKKIVEAWIAEEWGSKARPWGPRPRDSSSGTT